METSKIKHFLNDFDKFAKSKKISVSNLKLCLLFAFLVVVASLIFSTRLVMKAIDKIIVVERSGEYLKISAENSEKLFNTLVRSTCANLTYYANSFDRLNIHEQQAKSAFYANQDDLKTIFLKYQNDGSYHEALENGVNYKCEFEKINAIIGDTEPYTVSFTSLLSVYYSGHITRYRIESTGELIKTTPQYPDNVTGFFFQTYKQNIIKLVGDEQRNKN